MVFAFLVVVVVVFLVVVVVFCLATRWSRAARDVIAAADEPASSSNELTVFVATATKFEAVEVTVVTVGTLTADTAVPLSTGPTASHRAS